MGWCGCGVVGGCLRRRCPWGGGLGSAFGSGGVTPGGGRSYACGAAFRWVGAWVAPAVGGWCGAGSGVSVLGLARECLSVGLDGADAPAAAGGHPRPVPSPPSASTPTPAVPCPRAVVPRRALRRLCGRSRFRLSEGSRAAAPPLSAGVVPPSRRMCERPRPPRAVVPQGGGGTSRSSEAGSGGGWARRHPSAPGCADTPRPRPAPGSCGHRSVGPSPAAAGPPHPWPNRTE